MPRFTIRRWLAVVAAFALLDESSFGFLALVLMASIFWILPLGLAAWLGGFLRGGWIHVEIPLVLVALGLLVVFEPIRANRELPPIAVVGLVIVNSLGPFYAADRWRRGLPLAAGHWLWAWAGLVWTAEVWLASQSLRRSHMPVAYNASLKFAAAELLLAGVILALAFGKRPAGRDRVHLAGWLVVECDAIAWGWGAARRLGWVAWP